MNSYARIITRKDLQRLPFRGESQDYYALFPGTVQQDYRGTEFLHIRGSRHDEISYSFEGVDVRSAFTGLNMIRLIPEALDRITLKDNIRFFTAGERRSFDDHYRKFWDGFRLGEPDFSFQNRYTGQTLQELVGADELLVRAGNIPNAASLHYTMNGLISPDYSPLKLRLVSAAP